MWPATTPTPRCTPADAAATTSTPAGYWSTTPASSCATATPATSIWSTRYTFGARTAHAAGATTLTEDRLSFLRSCYAGAIAQIREDNQANTTPLHERGLSLARRFATHRDMILRFINDLSIPFSNNMAEREVRPVKVKQRSGGCWRTLEGLADFAVIWSYLSTATKHGHDHLDVLVELFTTGPWLPPNPAPT
jgi:transposase